jgi:lipoprotein-releasing system permease protein
VLNSFVLRVAIRYFKAKKNEKFISVITGFSLVGVMIGVAALIVVMSVMEGFHREFTKNIIGLNGDITIASDDESISNYTKIIAKLSEQSYVKRAIPTIYGQTLALGPRNNSGAIIRGIDYSDLAHKGEIARNAISGSFDDFEGNNVAALGSELARNLGIKVGQKLKLISPNTIATAFGSMPRSKEFEVVAIFSSNMYDYDAATVLMPLGAAQKFLSLENSINLIEINSIDPTASNIFAGKIQNLLGVGFVVTSWEQSNMQFLTALAIERTAMFTILSLIILVAAFNIISSIFMLVKDKAKDIAILRTIGASQTQIMLIFMCNGLFIGIIGSVTGAILGSAFAYNINNIRKFLESITAAKIFDPVVYFLYSLPTDLRAENIALVTSFTVILCYVASIYPATKAASLDPVEALRYE